MYFYKIPHNNVFLRKSTKYLVPSGVVLVLVRNLALAVYECVAVMKETKGTCVAIVTLRSCKMSQCGVVREV